MKIRILEQGRFTVAAYVKHNESTGELSMPALADLMGFAASYDGSVKGIRSLFEIYARNGRGRPYGVTTDQMHHANNNPDIYEFIRGDIRVFCFQDGNRVILTNAGLKKGRKANKSDVRQAIGVYDAYFEAKASGSIEIEEK